MTYFVSDDYGWEEHESWSEAVEHALRLEREGTQEPVDIFEQTDWRRSLLPEEREAAST